MTADPKTVPAEAVTASMPTSADFMVSRLVRQRDAAEQMMDKLYAQIAALERDKQELVKRVAELTAGQANPDSEMEAANG